VSSFNLVVLMGNLTRDVELRYLPSGAAVADASIAVNRVWFDKETREKKEEVNFFNCVLFGKQAEALAQYTKKGQNIHFSGRLRQETWEDKQTGAKRSAVKVIVESFQFIGRKDDVREGGEDSGGRPPRRKQPQSGKVRPDATAPQADAPEDDGSDVPF
jgi:single-strand DNA-binding protein